MIKKHKHTLLTTLILFSLIPQFNIISTAQSIDAQVVAKVGNNEIKASELKIRFELSPFVSEKYDYEMLDSLKMDFLYSMIAERILAQEASDLKLDTLEAFRFYFDPLKDLLLRDRLFNDKIASQISISDQEISSELVKYGYRLKLFSILFRDSVSAAGYFNSQDIISFDSTALYNENVIDRAQVYVTFGSMKDQSIEDILFNLDINEITSPFKTETGWIIFKLIDKEIGSLDPDDKNIRNSVLSRLKNEKIKKRYDDYLSGLLTGVTINIERDAFGQLTRTIAEIYRKKTDEFSKVQTGSKVYLTERDYEDIRDKMGEDLYLILFRIRDTEIKNLDFLSSLAFEEFGAVTQDSSEIISRLTQRVKVFIQQQILTLEAYKNGIDLTDDYESEISMWRNNYLSGKMKIAMLDSVKISTDEIRDYYNRTMVDSSGFQLISMRMVSTSSLDEISNILEAVNLGNQFSEIAGRFGATNSFVNEKGETGLKPSFLFGEVGTLAEKLNQGDLYGPVKTNEGYTIFELVDKKVSNDSLLVPFSEVRDQLYNRIRAEKLNGRIVDKIAAYLMNNEVSIYPESLKHLTVTKIPMFVHRMMGFGGRISAVPITNNWPAWQKELIQRKINIP